MDDAFEPTLQQTALICSTRFEGEFKVSFGEFIQLGHIRSDGCLIIEHPHDTDLVSPSRHAFFKCLKQQHCCGRILWPNAPKHYVSVTEEPHHGLCRVVGPDIDQKASIRRE